MRNRRSRSLINSYTRDYYGGALMLLIGLGAAFKGLDYHMGSLTQMGPGFFPVALGAILALLGAAIAATAASAPRPKQIEEAKRPEWAGWICISAGVVAFVLLGKYGGLLPATFALVFISALGDRENSLLSALILAAALSVICVVIFWWALQLQFPLFRWG
jgi:hypothetical protein